MENFSIFTILHQWIPQVIAWNLISSFFFLNLTLTACLIAAGSHTWKANEQLIHVCPFLNTHNYTDLHYTFHLSSFHRVKICTLFSNFSSGRLSGDLIILLLLSEGFPVLLHFLRKGAWKCMFNPACHSETADTYTFALVWVKQILFNRKWAW